MKIAFEHIRKTFFTFRGRVDALIDVNLEVADGEFFVLLGPSGCGKSTTLNLVAGLERPSGGVIRFGDQTVADADRRIMVPPRNRDVAMVFQSYALYPHMHVFDNIAFPLKIAGQDKERIRRAVEKTAEMLGIKDMLGRKPRELSGGQRQRVSIARALVRDPEVFLLDEPLSNLDAQLRTSTRGELKRLQREMGITTLYVTHDQTEAMTLGDRIALFNRGRLVQVGSPKEMYRRPGKPFTAAFIGSPPMNLIPAEIREEGGRIRIAFDNTAIMLGETTDHLNGIAGPKALMGIRPEHIRIAENTRDSVLCGRIQNVEPLGREVIYHVQTEQNRILVLSEKDSYRLDQTVGLSFRTERIHLFEPER
jgi:multiple sugar transport system ATP-binding protein